MLTKYKFSGHIEALFIEMNFPKCKWLFCGLNHPPSQCNQYLFNSLDKALDVIPLIKTSIDVKDSRTVYTW